VIFLSSDHHKSGNTAGCCQCWPSKSTRNPESPLHEDNYEKEKESISQTTNQNTQQEEEQQQVHHHHQEEEELGHYHNAQHEMKVNRLSFFGFIFDLLFH